MEGFGLDILTLFSGCPELDGAWSVVDILAHSDDIVKELFAIELGIFPEGFIDGFNGYDSVQGQVIQDQVFLHRAEEELSVSVFLQQVGVENEFVGFPCVE